MFQQQGAAWVGQDGNIYTRVSGQDGVRNLGSAQGTGILVSGGKWNGLDVIADPNRSAPKPTVDWSGDNTQLVPQGTGAVAAGPVAPSRAQVDPLLASLSSLDTVLTNKNAQTDAEYGRAIEGYNSQDKIDRQAFDKNTFQNESSLTSNNQAALLNAANGASGLRGVMASLGGLAGSGADVIKRLVGLAANADTGAARQSFETNSENLNSAWGQAEQQQRQRRKDAEATRDNNRQNNQAGVLTSRQGILQQLANLYGDSAPEGGRYASEAAALSAPIAQTTRATVAPYAAPSASFSPAALQEYLGGTQNLDVDTSGGGSPVPANSPFYQSGKKKEQLTGVA